MVAAIGNWLDRRPRWLVYTGGFVLLVLAILSVVEVRDRTTTRAGPLVLSAHSPVAGRPLHVAAESADTPPALPVRAGTRHVRAAPTADRRYAFTIAGTMPAIEHVGRLARLTLHVTCRGIAAPHLVIAFTGLNHWVWLGMGSSMPARVPRVGSGDAWDLGPIAHGRSVTLTLDLMPKDAGNQAVGILVSHTLDLLPDLTGIALASDDGGYAELAVAVEPASIGVPHRP